VKKQRKEKKRKRGRRIKDVLSAWVSCPVSLAEGVCLAKTSGAINPAEKKLRNYKKEESRII